MNKTIWILLIGLIGIVGCNSNSSSQEYTFAAQFAELQALDQEFNASFKLEQLDRTMVPLENIDSLLEQLEKKKKEIEKQTATNDTAAILAFIEVRRLMLSSQKMFQLGKRIGDIGLVTDKKGYSCSEVKYILDAAYYFNESWVYGLQAQSKLDDVLFEFRDLPEVQNLIGVDDNKTAFYLSPLDQVKNIVRNNYEALQKNCRVQVVTK